MRRIILGALCLAASLLHGVAASAIILEGYPTDMTVRQGDVLELHVRSDQAYRVSIWRQGLTLDPVLGAREYQGTLYPVPAMSWERGCGWPVTCNIPISIQWRPGAYLARLESNGNPAWIPFVVRARFPGSFSKMLVQLPINTWQAYNSYGGKSLYGDLLHNPNNRAYRVSFLRPYNVPNQDGSATFFNWEAPFLSFLEAEGYSYEVCTSIDLHREPNILSAYDLFVSIGHDEYYSKEMYDTLERYVDSGGNLAFFSANTLWWQVRYEDSERTMVCYKSQDLDPYSGVDNSRVTVNWHAPPVLRPPARLMGIYYNGSYGINPGPYHVADPHHWAYRGAAVDSGQAFGDPMVAYEVDGRTKDSPRILDVIARSVIPDANNGGILRAAEMVYYERSPAYGFPFGHGGKVFAGGTVNYVQGLSSEYNSLTRTLGHRDQIVRDITMNVLDKLGCSLDTPKLDSPLDDRAVSTQVALLQWHAPTTQRSDAPVVYTVFWLPEGGRPDSLRLDRPGIWAPVLPETTYYWFVRAQSECGLAAWSDVGRFRTRTPTDVGAPEIVVLPDHGAVITILVPADAEGTVRIYDVSGRRIRDFDRERFRAGANHLQWNLRSTLGKDVPSGVYFLEANFGTVHQHLKFTIRR